VTGGPLVLDIWKLPGGSLVTAFIKQHNDIFMYF